MWSAPTATAEQTGLVERDLAVNCDHRVLAHDRVLREGRASHEVEELLALALESRCAIWHDALALRGSDGTAEVCLARLRTRIIHELRQQSV